MDTQNLPQSQVAMQRLSKATDELIAVINSQKQNFAVKLAEERNNTAGKDAQISALEAQIKDLQEEKEKLRIELVTAQNNKEANTKIQEMQQELDSRANKINGLQIEIQNLNNALNNRKIQLEELKNKNDALSESLTRANDKIAELQQMVTQTAGNIDDVVAKLEKVLEENGASNNNN